MDVPSEEFNMAFDNNNTALRNKETHPVSQHKPFSCYEKVAIISGNREIRFSAMLYHIGVFARQQRLGLGDRCIIFANNSEGWIYALYAVWMKKAIAVPVDASSTAEDLAYILQDCRPQSIWTSHVKSDVVSSAMRLSGVDVNVMYIDDYVYDDPEGEVTLPAGGEETLCSYDCGGVEVPSLALVTMLSEDDKRTALIIYTSGTTGSPKGVMLSFENLKANINGVAYEVPIFHETRRTIMLLPVHHVLPLMGTIVGPLMIGGGIAICPSLSGPDIMDTLCRGEVAMMVGVPRLWQTLYKAIKSKIDAHAVTRFLYWMCEKVQSRNLSRFIFKSIHKKMGGHVDYLVSGGAALDPEIARFFGTIGMVMIEGYGMTEAAPIIAFTRPWDIKPGCVGEPLPSMECKIVDGELYAKGPNVMQGYYNRPEETAAVVRDGWLRTGDLATIDEKGRVTITGRSKEIIVLSNGKNVNPSELEFKLEMFAEQVKEAAVVPDGDKLCAIIVPNKEWAAGRSVEDVEEQLKKDVLQPYNLSVENYKKVMRLFVYDGELPRTKLDKLQRFKLLDIIKNGAHTAPKKHIDEPTFEEYQIIKRYIIKEKKLDEVLPSDNIETDLAFDSLDKVGLQEFLENSFGVSLSADDIARFRNISEMAERVAESKTQVESADVDWHSILHDERKGITLPDTWPSVPWIVHAFKTFFKMQFRLASKGVRNIPDEGPFILAANHQSYLDGMFVMAYVQLSQIRNTYFFAKEKHVNTPLRRWLAARHNVVVLEQDKMKNSIIKLGDVLKQGRNVIIFPEGTRTPDGSLGEFKKMFAILSVELGVPVVPVAINGAFEALPKGRKIPLPKKIVVEYLPPIFPSEDCTYDSLAEDVRTNIAQHLKQRSF